MGEALVQKERVELGEVFSVQYSVEIVQRFGRFARSCTMVKCRQYGHMVVVIMIGFLFLAAVVGRATIVAIVFPLPKWIRIGYLGWCVAAAVAAYFSTFRFVYYTNPNTRFHGWPIPWVVFQRDSATDPWLDFVGVITLLAYPLNLVLFALLPAIVTLVLWRRAEKSSRITAGGNQGTKTQNPTVSLLR